MDHNKHQMIVKFILAFNLILVTKGALLPSNPGSIPLTACNRRCLDTFTGCLSFYDVTSLQCRLLASCTRSCHRDHIGNMDYDRNESDDDDVRSSSMMTRSFKKSRKEVNKEAAANYKSMDIFDNADFKNTISEKLREQIKRKEIIAARVSSSSKRAVIVKRACLGDCDAERYMCSQISDSLLGVYLCNRSNNMCRRKCGL